MKYPFDLTHKPIKHYFTKGVVLFSMREGKLHYDVEMINKKERFHITTGIVHDLIELEYLTTIKQFPILINKLNAIPLQIKENHID